MQNNANRADILRLCAQDIAANADKLLADVLCYKDADIVIRFRNGDVPTVEVTQEYIPEEVIKYYAGE